jgi:hypothetical protein
MPGLGRLNSAAFADWDFDGYLDLLAAAPDGEIFLLHGSDSGFAARESLLTRSGETLRVFAEDFDFDGLPDLWAHSEGVGAFVYRNTGTAANPVLDPSPVELRTESGSALASAGGALLDWDGDGIKDWVSSESQGIGYRALRRQGAYRDAADAARLLNVAGDAQICPSCILAARVPENGMPQLLRAEPGRPLLSHASRLLGDINGDGTVDVLDFALLADAWEKRESDPDWDPASNLVVGPGAEKIDVLDLGAMADSWGMWE